VTREVAQTSVDFILTERPEGVTFALKVRAGAGRTEVTGFWNGALKLNVAKAPAQGEANRECLRFLAICLGVPRTAVEILSGEYTPRKVILVRGLTRARAYSAVMESRSKSSRRKEQHG
jgi:uncharacterized protein